MPESYWDMWENTRTQYCTKWTQVQSTSPLIVLKKSFDDFPFLLFRPANFPLLPQQLNNPYNNHSCYSISHRDSQKRTRHKSASLFTPLQEIWDLHHVWKTWKTSCHSNGALIVIYHGTISKNSPTKRQKNPPTLKPRGTFIHTPMHLQRPSFLSIQKPSRFSTVWTVPPGASNQSFELPDTDCDGVPVIASTWTTRFFVDQLLQSELVWTCKGPFQFWSDLYFRNQKLTLKNLGVVFSFGTKQAQSEQKKLKLHLVFCPKDPKGFRMYLCFFEVPDL